MKTNKRIILMLIFITSLSFTCCIEDGDFTVPQNLGAQENNKLKNILDSINFGKYQLKSIKELKALYISGKNPLEIVSNIVIKGYVVSSDKTGNYYQEFYMQDSPENPTAGIKVALNLANSYNQFNIGREVYIYLKDLFIGETNSGDGVTAIGGRIKLTDTRELENISSNQIKNHLFRSSKTTVIVPKTVSLGGLNDTNNIGTFVTIKNAFFSSNLKAKSFVDPNEDFDTKRKIETCQGPGIVSSFLETSSFASFANRTLPEEGGSINAVVSKDFRGNFTVLVLNTFDDVKMKSERCTPLVLTDFTKTLLEEGFETTSGKTDIPNWTNYIEAGSKFWTSYLDENSESNATKIGSFRSGNDSNISWLITPPINLDDTLEEYLSFETSTSFADQSTLEVLISDNWNGTETTITNANWVSLPARVASKSDAINSFINSTFINLSTYKGNVYIAFKYTGNENEDFDGTYKLDNITIKAK